MCKYYYFETWVGAYDVISGGRAQETAERDDGSETSKVHEEERGNTLYVYSVRDVAQIPREFTLYVIDQSATESLTPKTKLIALILLLSHFEIQGHDSLKAQRSGSLHGTSRVSG